jgi:hypothetical protein
MEMESIPLEPKLRISWSWSLKIPATKMIFSKFPWTENVLVVFLLIGNLHDKLLRLKIKRLQALEKIHLILSNFFLR